MSIEGRANENNSLLNLKGKINAIPPLDDTLTKERHSAEAKAVGEALKEKVSKSDIVDDLTSDAKDKTLSANQGKELLKMIGDIKLSEAGTVGYDNATSGLSSTNMQSAIDEVVNKTLPKSGGMVEGVVHVRSANNGYASLHKNNTATTDYGMKVVDRTKDNKNAYITVRAMTDEFSFTDSNGKTSKVLHEGNKPFGSYEGNGSAEEVIIDTNGVGRLMLVYNSSYFSFVTPEGALVVDLAERTFDWFVSTKVYYLNGVLGLHLSNDAFNKKGETYYYQAI